MVYVAAWWKYKPQKYLVVKAGWVALYSVLALSRDGVSSQFEKHSVFRGQIWLEDAKQWKEEEKGKEKEEEEEWETKMKKTSQIFFCNHENRV